MNLRDKCIKAFSLPEPLALNVNEPNGTYLCEFYAYDLKFPNGNTYKTTYGVKCMESACGGWHNIIKVVDGKAYQINDIPYNETIDMYDFDSVISKYADTYNLGFIQQHSNDLTEVKSKTKLPEGTFTKSAKEIQETLLKYAKDRNHAVKMINFYINRAGDNLPNKDEVLKAKELIEATKQESSNIFTRGDFDSYKDLGHPHYISEDRVRQLARTSDGHEYDLSNPTEKFYYDLKKKFEQKDPAIRIASIFNDDDEYFVIKHNGIKSQIPGDMLEETVYTLAMLDFSVTDPEGAHFSDPKDMIVYLTHDKAKLDFTIGE